jgi:hypothetical protein
MREYVIHTQLCAPQPISAIVYGLIRLPEAPEGRNHGTDVPFRDVPVLDGAQFVFQRHFRLSSTKCNSESAIDLEQITFGNEMGN